MIAVRKSKGDVNYYLEKEGDIYRILKTVKIQVTNKKNKTKRIKVSDFKFNKNYFENIDFCKNGLRLRDKEYILQMILDIEAKNE